MGKAWSHVELRPRKAPQDPAWEGQLGVSTLLPPALRPGRKRGGSRLGGGSVAWMSGQEEGAGQEATPRRTQTAPASQAPAEVPEDAVLGTGPPRRELGLSSRGRARPRPTTEGPVDAR